MFVVMLKKTPDVCSCSEPLNYSFVWWRLRTYSSSFYSVSFILKHDPLIRWVSSLTHCCHPLYIFHIPFSIGQAKRMSIYCIISLVRLISNYFTVLYVQHCSFDQYMLLYREMIKCRYQLPIKTWSFKLLNALESLLYILQGQVASPWKLLNWTLQFFSDELKI